MNIKQNTGKQPYTIILCITSFVRGPKKNSIYRITQYRITSVTTGRVIFFLNFIGKRR